MSEDVLASILVVCCSAVTGALLGRSNLSTIVRVLIILALAPIVFLIGSSWGEATMNPVEEADVIRSAGRFIATPFVALAWGVIGVFCWIFVSFIALVISTMTRPDSNQEPPPGGTP